MAGTRAQSGDQYGSGTLHSSHTCYKLIHSLNTDIIKHSRQFRMVLSSQLRRASRK